MEEKGLARELDHGVVFESISFMIPFSIDIKSKCRKNGKSQQRSKMSVKIRVGPNEF